MTYELIFDEDSQEALAKWISERTKVEHQGKYLGLTKNGNLIGCAGYEVYDDFVNCHIAFDEQIPRFFIKCMFDYPYEQLNKNKLIVIINRENKKSERLAKKLGFKFLNENEQFLIYQLNKEDFRSSKWATL
jgi:RimJ/RimL family protein N-acetyltransferase